MATAHQVDARDGSVVPLAVDTLCLHSDTAGADRLAIRVRAALDAAGATVRAIVRPESQQTAPEGSTALRVPLNAAALRPAFAGASVVVHLAGVVESVRAGGYAAVNVTGTEAVARAAREAGARLVHISSLAAAGPAPATAPRSEDLPPNPITDYGRSKLAGERAVAEVEGLDWTILRPGAVYGPGDRALLPDRKSTRLNSSHIPLSRMPSSA